MSPKTGSDDDMKVKVVSQDDWQRCRITLDAAAVQAQGTPMQEHIQALSDMLPLLQSQQLPTQAERRGMAKKLGVAQEMNAESLMGKLQRSFVELVLTRRCDLDSGIASSSGHDDPRDRKIMQEVLEFGRFPQEIHNPTTPAASAEHALARKVRRRNLRQRVQQMLAERKETMDTSTPPKRRRLDAPFCGDGLAVAVESPTPCREPPVTPLAASMLAQSCRKSPCPHMDFPDAGEGHSETHYALSKPRIADALGDLFGDGRLSQGKIEGDSDMHLASSKPAADDDLLFAARDQVQAVFKHLLQFEEIPKHHSEHQAVYLELLLHQIFVAFMFGFCSCT